MSPATPLAIDDLPDWTGDDGLPSLREHRNGPNIAPPTSAIDPVAEAFEKGRAQGVREAHKDRAEDRSRDEAHQQAMARAKEAQLALLSQIRTNLEGTILPTIHEHEARILETLRRVIDTIEALFHSSLDARLKERCQALTAAIDAMATGTDAPTITLYVHPDDLAILDDALSSASDLLLCGDKTIRQGTCNASWQGGEIVFDPFDQATQLLHALSAQLTPPTPLESDSDH
ncbi:MAG: FliH/SctL family protein [Pseudomonadota bacterium]